MSFSFRIAIIGILFLGIPLVVWAESSSANYTLWGHSITGGGDLSSSTNYTGFSTVGDLGGVDGTSTNYISNVGFQQLELDSNTMFFTLSSNSLSLDPNPITTGAVSSGSIVATVGTFASHGYTLTATEASAFQNFTNYALADVADGTVSAGSEEFGISATGTDAAFSDDQAVTTSPLTVGSSSIPVVSNETTITFKAGIALDSEGGNYSGQVVFIATSNF